MHADGATIDFNKVLGDHQAHANAFVVLLCCAPELAKHVKQLVRVIFLDASTVVLNMNHKQLFARRVSHVYPNFAALSKLEGILS